MNVRGHDPVGIVSAVQWELAKGHMRATVAALGQMHGGENKFEALEQRVESFIRDVEGEELHLP